MALEADPILWDGQRVHMAPLFRFPLSVYLWRAVVLGCQLLSRSLTAFQEVWFLKVYVKRGGTGGTVWVGDWTQILGILLGS